MTTFVSTLGFDTSHLHTLLVDEDVEDGDRLLLVRPDDEDRRGEDAVQSVRGTVDMIDKEVTTDVREFDPADFEGTVTELVDLLDSIEDCVVVNVAGGDRALVVALAVAVMSTSTDVSTVRLRSDVTRESQRVSLPALRPPPDGNEREVLRCVLENEPVSNTEIAEATNLSDATVSRKVENLEEEEYVVVEEDGGSNSVCAAFPSLLVRNRLG